MAGQAVAAAQAARGEFFLPRIFVRASVGNTSGQNVETGWQEGAGLLFLGQFVAAYLTRTAGKHAYAGLQMGLVLPLLVVAPPAEFGSLTPAVQRLEGVLLGLVASVVVAGLWPRFPLADRVAPAPPPVFPGEMDV